MRQAAAKKREGAADYFTHLAQVLEDTSASLSIPVYPSGKCAELLVHANGMTKALKGVVDENDLIGLQGRLVSGHSVERLFSQVSGQPPDALLARLSQLNESAGIFRAMAALLRT